MATPPPPPSSADVHGASLSVKRSVGFVDRQRPLSKYRDVPLVRTAPFTRRGDESVHRPQNTSLNLVQKLQSSMSGGNVSCSKPSAPTNSRLPNGDWPTLKEMGITVPTFSQPTHNTETTKPPVQAKINSVNRQRTCIMPSDAQTDVRPPVRMAAFTGRGDGSASEDPTPKPSVDIKSIDKVVESSMKLNPATYPKKGTSRVRQNYYTYGEGKECTTRNGTGAGFPRVEEVTLSDSDSTDYEPRISLPYVMRGQDGLANTMMISNSAAHPNVTVFHATP